MSEIAQTTYNTAPDNSTITKDPYKIRTKETVVGEKRDTVNKISENTNSDIPTEAVSVKGGQEASSTLKEKAKEAKIVLSSAKTAAKKGRSIADFLVETQDALKKRSLTDRLSNIGNVLSKRIDGMEPGVLKDIASKAIKYTPTMATVSGITSIIKTGNLKNAKAIGGLFNSAISDNNIKNSLDGSNLPGVNFRNVGGTIDGLGTIYSSASKTGVTGTYKELRSLMKNDEDIDKLTKATLPTALKNSDLPSLKYMSDNTDTDTMRNMLPNADDQFGRGFKLPEGYNSKKDGPGLIADSKSVLGKLNPSWNETKLPSGETAVDVTVIQQGSDDFKNIMKQDAINSNDPKTKLNVIGATIPPTDVNSEIAKQYPNIVNT